MEKRMQSNDIDHQEKEALYPNIPVEKDEKDLFNMKLPMLEIEGAIEGGANMIGIISEYGEGKSSLIRYLGEKQKEKFKVCHICLWNFFDDTAKDDKDLISNMTHSFLYQMAKGVVGPELARTVNRRISRNYGLLFLEVNLTKLEKILVGVLALGWLGEGIALPLLPWLVGTVLKKTVELEALVEFWKLICEKINYFFLALLVWILGRRGITFSNKNSLGGRIPGTADAYEVFDYIVEAALKQEHKSKESYQYLICVEDLDRLESKKDARRFLKELYKYCNMLSEDEKKKFVFLVAASPQLYEFDEKDKAEDVYQLNELYSKIFEYTIEIRPIYEDDRQKVIKKLLGEREIKNEINSVIGDVEEIRKTAVEWIGKGKNPAIRDFKNRLNRALSIQKTCRNVNFAECAKVAYLEDEYGSELGRLVRDQKRFNRFMKRVETIRESERDKNNLKNGIRNAAMAEGYRIQNPSKQIGRTVNTKDVISLDFWEDWEEALCEGSLAVDYSKYIFRTGS